jgi:hypothetical protein
MSSTPQNFPPHGSIPTPNAAGPLSGAVPSPAEITLQWIARLPAPEGLEDRVIHRIHIAPRPGRVLHWPGRMSSRGAWMRGAAAAAIVFVVAGGGWGIYMRVQPAQPGKVLVMPRGGTAGGFSGAGAIRTPDTLHRPVISQPATEKANDTKAVKKTSGRAVHAPLRVVQPASQSLSMSQPKVAAAR